MPFKILPQLANGWSGYKNDAFKLRTYALFSKALDEDIVEGVYRHIEPIDQAILDDMDGKAPIGAWPEIMSRQLPGLLEECASLQRISFRQFVQFLSLEGITSATEMNKRLIWATDRVIERIVFAAYHFAQIWVEDGNARAPAWLQELADEAAVLLDRDPDREEPGLLWIDRLESIEARPAPKARPSSIRKLFDYLASGLERNLDRNRRRLIEEFLAPAMDAHAEAKPELEGKTAIEAPPSDLVANSLTDQPLAPETIRRAKLVETVIGELTYLKPRMMGQPGDYETAKKEFEFQDFVTFQVCDRDSKLKQKLVDIAGRKQVKAFAKEIVARKFSRSPATIDDDWKDYSKQMKKQ